VVDYDRTGNITSDRLASSLTLKGWNRKHPYRLSSANVRPEFLGIPELQDYLRFNADFPRTLLATVPNPIAIPLGLALDRVSSSPSWPRPSGLDFLAAAFWRASQSQSDWCL
jgi:hypothetical protein